MMASHCPEAQGKSIKRAVLTGSLLQVVGGTLAQVKADFGGRHVALGFSHDKQRAEHILADRALVASIDDYGAAADLQLAEGADPQALLAALVREGVGLRRFELVEPSLQSIFMARVGADAAVAARSGEAA